jgi:hypothetical protein
MDKHSKKTPRPDGVMALNTLSSRTLKQAVCFTHAQLAKSFKSDYQLDLPIYNNAVGAVFRQPVQARDLRKRLSHFPALCHLDFRLRRLE